MITGCGMECEHEIGQHCIRWRSGIHFFEALIVHHRHSYMGGVHGCSVTQHSVARFRFVVYSGLVDPACRYVSLLRTII